MKLLFITQIVPYPPHGGVLQRGYNILRELAKKNTIHLAAFIHNDTLRNAKQIDDSRKALAEFCETIQFQKLWPKRSWIHRIIALSAGLVLKEPFSVIAHASDGFRYYIQSILKKRSIDIVHYDTIALAQYWNNCYAIPSVMTHHNIESQLLERRAIVEKFHLTKKYIEIQVKKLRAYEALMCSRFDLNVMMSKVDEEILKTLSADVKTWIVPNGVDLKYFQVLDNCSDLSVIYTGGMNMFANRDAVMFFIGSIWPRIRSIIPNARFDIIGQDPPGELLEMARTDSSLKIHGYVDDIRPYVQKSSVYVVPIRVGGGTRLKVLDALAMGKAIVSTSVGCEGIEVTNGVNIIIEDNPIIFADQVVKLLKNELQRRSLGKAARALAEAKYSWESICEQLMEGYLIAREYHKYR